MLSRRKDIGDFSAVGFRYGIVLHVQVLNESQTVQGVHIPSQDPSSDPVDLRLEGPHVLGNATLQLAEGRDLVLGKLKLALIFQG